MECKNWIDAMEDLSEFSGFDARILVLASPGVSRTCF